MDGVQHYRHSLVYLGVIQVPQASVQLIKRRLLQGRGHGLPEPICHFWDFWLISSIKQLRNYLTNSRITLPTQELPNQLKNCRLDLNTPEISFCKYLLQVLIIASSIKTFFSVFRLSIVELSTLFIKLDLKTKSILRLICRVLKLETPLLPVWLKPYHFHST